MSSQAFCSVKAKKVVCPWLCVGEQQQGELGTRARQCPTGEGPVPCSQQGDSDAVQPRVPIPRHVFSSEAHPISSQQVRVSIGMDSLAQAGRGTCSALALMFLWMFVFLAWYFFHYLRLQRCLKGGSKFV